MTKFNIYYCPNDINAKTMLTGYLMPASLIGLILLILFAMQVDEWITAANRKKRFQAIMKAKAQNQTNKANKE